MSKPFQIPTFDYKPSQLVSNPIIRNVEHMLEIVAPMICPCLSYKDIIIGLCPVSKRLNRISVKTPLVTNISAFFAYGTFVVLRTNIGVISDQKPITAFLNKFNLQNISEIEIETSKRDNTDWCSSEVCKELFKSFEQINKLQSVMIDICSTNPAFIKNICYLIHHNVATLHTLKFLSTTLDISLNYNDDGDITFGQIQKNQKIFDKWIAKIIHSLTYLPRSMKVNNILKNIHISFIGNKTCHQLCKFQNLCNYENLTIDIVDCKILNDVINRDIKELHVRKYIDNWNGFQLLPLFKKVNKLCIPCGGMFPFTMAPIKTDVFRLYITKQQLVETRYPLYQMVESIPGNIKRLEIWNKCNNLNDSQQIDKWWKWISYLMNKNCKELLIRNIEISDIIDMLKHKGIFTNINLLIIKMPHYDEETYQRIKQLIPETVVFRLTSYS